MAHPLYLAFPLASDRLLHYSTGDNAVFSDLFDASTNRMVLDVWPGQYTPRLRALGSTDVAEGLRSSLPRTAATRQEATVEISCGMLVIAAVLNELRENAIADRSHKITVHDGCFVEMGDRAQGYTVRDWWLQLPIVPKSVQTRQTVGAAIDDRIYAGFTLDFTAFG